MTKRSSAPEFWRYVNALKFSAAVAAVESFSTREPAGVSLGRLFQAVGVEVGLFIGSERQFHFFTNPDLREMHLVECVPGGPTPGQYFKLSDVQFQYEFKREDPLGWGYFDPAKVGSKFPPALLSAMKGPGWVALAPFFKGNTPFGYYAFCWYGDDSPPPFRPGEDGDALKEASIVILNYVHDVASRLVCNHYPMHRDTYIPSFQRVGFQSVCILFADIRNFTTAFESGHLRMENGDAYSRALVGFLKAYLEAAAIAIAQPGIGRIDKFIGDGIMATFGEYVVCPDADRPLLSCLLGLYAAAILQSAFEKLKARLFQHNAVRAFLSEYNDVLDIRLGVGINYGEVMFDYFGSSDLPDAPESNLIGGYTEYTAVGDHVNAAQRLEGLANKPIGAIGLLERGVGRERRSASFTAPIVMSRTVFRRSSGALARPASNTVPPEEEYRSSFTLKGKGSAVEAFEVHTYEINGDFIIWKMKDIDKSNRLYQSIGRTWRAEARSFEFDDAIIDQLARKYLPPT
jgi:class 3 adenylate cyclase